MKYLSRKIRHSEFWRSVKSIDPDDLNRFCCYSRILVNKDEGSDLTNRRSRLTKFCKPCLHIFFCWNRNTNDARLREATVCSTKKKVSAGLVLRVIDYRQHHSFFGNTIAHSPNAVHSKLVGLHSIGRQIVLDHNAILRGINPVGSAFTAVVNVVHELFWMRGKFAGPHVITTA